MSVDVIVLLILLVAVIFVFRRFSSVVYFVAIVDILLRILTFVKNNLGLPDVKALIDQYIPESLPTIFARYTNGSVYTIIMWGYVIIFSIFLFYTMKTFWYKRKWKKWVQKKIGRTKWIYYSRTSWCDFLIRNQCLNCCTIEWKCVEGNNLFKQLYYRILSC